MKLSFQEEVERFRAWAPSHEGTYGEWECDYEHWIDLYVATEEKIERTPVDSFDEPTLKNILYVLGRDNECERIRIFLTDYPQLLRILAEKGTKLGDSDARWQLAKSIGESKFEDAADLLRPYLGDSDEYVRRRSLMSIAPHAPEEAEEIAKKNMEDEFEYSRIAGLHVLHEVNSQSLEYYLDRHQDDPSEYVRSNVDDIRSRKQKYNPEVTY